MTIEAMAGAIEQYVRSRNGGVTFVELDQNIPGFTGGDLAMEVAPNVILWTNLTETAVAAVNLLKTSFRVQLTPTTPLVYIMDGKMLRFPTARRMPRGGYKTERWLPVVFGPLGVQKPPKRRKSAA